MFLLIINIYIILNYYDSIFDKTRKKWSKNGCKKW